MDPFLNCTKTVTLTVHVMAYFHYRTRIWIRTQIGTPSLMVTLYYAELFPLVLILIQIPVQMVSRMVTVPILGTDLHLNITIFQSGIRVRIQTSGKILLSTGIHVGIQVRIRLRQWK